MINLNINHRDTPKPVRIHLISHNHWDREWIFTARFANRWLLLFFSNLIQRLQEQPQYRFVLDGQTLILEDYLNQLPPDQAAAREQDIRHLVKAGRLLIGPAYLQPDWSLVSGEALVRNLLIGDKICKRFGASMKAGWLLDNFGQIAQTPQILSGFGIGGAFVWRGVEMPPESLKTEFWWESPDGSRILGIYLVDSYRNAMALSMTKDIARERVIFQSQALLRFATTPNVLLMNGYEQVPEPDDVLPIIADLNQTLGEGFTCVQSTPSEYLDAVRACRPDLPVLNGYMYSGRFAPILKGVFSSRSYLVQQNNECQRELERWAEKFNAIAWAFGFDYPAERFEQAWKTLLLNHTHDDMCGCCTDPIAHDMQERFAEVNRMARIMSSESLCAIAQSVDSSKAGNIALIVFNPSILNRSEIVGFTMELEEHVAEFHLIDDEAKPVPCQIASRIGRKVDLYCWAEDVPSVGYKTFYLAAGPPEKPESQPVVKSDESEKTMENEHIAVKINFDGTLSMRDKKRNKVYSNLGFFEDGGDCGDTYDYSFPETDRVVSSRNRPAVITLETAGPLVVRYRIEIKLPLPVALTKNRKKRSARTRQVKIVNHVELRAGSKYVAIHTMVHNVVKDHRLRVLLPTGIQSDTAFAGMPFDVAKFPLTETGRNIPPTDAIHDLMLAGCYTVPVNTHPFQRFVGMVQPDCGLTVFSRGLSEYEVLPQNSTIALTLIRSVGWLTRADLLTRVGDVGPQIFTPEAQCLGARKFDYAVYPHDGDLEKANPSFESDCHVLKFRVVQTKQHAGKLPNQLSFLSFQKEIPKGAMKLTALKCAEDGDGLIARIINEMDRPAMGTLKIGCMVLKAWRANLNEEILQELVVHDNSIKVKAGTKEIVTLKIRLSPIDLIKVHHKNSTGVLPPPTLEGDDKDSEVSVPSLLTSQEVGAEFSRAAKLEKQLLKIREEIAVLQKKPQAASGWNMAEMTEIHHLKAKEATLVRQCHEARISALVNKELALTNQIEGALHDIGEDLNWARVYKRVGEFLIHYFEGKNKQKAADASQAEKAR
ncbi:MAG: hypothetical protein JW786_08075 [Desulfobacterales bacterium]|nr:hypothetical protein [Desulfobacterales bacterium]